MGLGSLIYHVRSGGTRSYIDMAMKMDATLHVLAEDSVCDHLFTGLSHKKITTLLYLRGLLKMGMKLRIDNDLDTGLLVELYDKLQKHRKLLPTLMGIHPYLDKDIDRCLRL